MTTEQEIEFLTKQLELLKNIKGTEKDNSKFKFMLRADTLDPKFKKLYHDINNAVESAGWKDFYYGVFNYQKNCVDSGYLFK